VDVVVFLFVCGWVGVVCLCAGVCVAVCSVCSDAVLGVWVCGSCYVCAPFVI